MPSPARGRRSRHREAGCPPGPHSAPCRRARSTESSAEPLSTTIARTVGGRAWRQATSGPEFHVTTMASARAGGSRSGIVSGCEGTGRGNRLGLRQRHLHRRRPDRRRPSVPRSRRAPCGCGHPAPAAPTTSTSRTSAPCWVTQPWWPASPAGSAPTSSGTTPSAFRCCRRSEHCSSWRRPGRRAACGGEVQAFGLVEFVPARALASASCFGCWSADRPWSSSTPMPEGAEPFVPAGRLLELGNWVRTRAPSPCRRAAVARDVRRRPRRAQGAPQLVDAMRLLEDTPVVRPSWAGRGGRTRSSGPPSPPQPTWLRRAG